MIPSANNCRPPMKRIIVTRLAHPAILPPMVNFLIIMKRIPRKEKTKEAKPAHVAKFKGASEKLTKPSIE